MKNYEGNQENLELLKELLSHIGGELVEAETYYDNFKVVLGGNTYEYNTLYGIDEALVHMYLVNINKLSSEMKEKCQKAIVTIESNSFDMVELYRLAYDEEVSLVDMYEQVIENDIGNIDNVNNRETIEMYIKDMMDKEISVSHMLAALENSTADFFAVWLGNSMETPEEINNKLELLEALL